MVVRKGLEVGIISASSDGGGKWELPRLIQKADRQLTTTYAQHNNIPPQRETTHVWVTQMVRRSAQFAILLAATVTTATAQNCFWRSSGKIRTIGWYACNNTRATPGGAQLCCIEDSQCGQDSICLKDNKYYVGGCTDGTYGDAVCRTSCSEWVPSILPRTHSAKKR
jgi:hypothetical protein